MKLTNELREYVQRRMVEIIPEPNSKEDAEAVKAECQLLKERYEAYMEAKSKEFIKEELKNKLLEGCIVEPVGAYSVYGSLRTDWRGAPAVKKYEEESREQTDFRQRINEKIFALLSVQKEIDDLDAFILHIVETTVK